MRGPAVPLEALGHRARTEATGRPVPLALRGRVGLLAVLGPMGPVVPPVRLGRPEAMEHPDLRAAQAPVEPMAPLGPLAAADRLVRMVRTGHQAQAVPPEHPVPRVVTAPLVRVDLAVRQEQMGAMVPVDLPGQVGLQGLTGPMGRAALPEPLVLPGVPDPPEPMVHLARVGQVVRLVLMEVMERVDHLVLVGPPDQAVQVEALVPTVPADRVVHPVPKVPTVPRERLAHPVVPGLLEHMVPAGVPERVVALDRMEPRDLADRVEVLVRMVLLGRVAHPDQKAATELLAAQAPVGPLVRMVQVVRPGLVVHLVPMVHPGPVALLAAPELMVATEHRGLLAQADRLAAAVRMEHRVRQEQVVPGVAMVPAEAVVRLGVVEPMGLLVRAVHPGVRDLTEHLERLVQVAHQEPTVRMGRQVPLAHLVQRVVMVRPGPREHTERLGLLERLDQAVLLGLLAHTGPVGPRERQVPRDPMGQAVPPGQVDLPGHPGLMGQVEARAPRVVLALMGHLGLLAHLGREAAMVHREAAGLQAAPGLMVPVDRQVHLALRALTVLLVRLEVPVLQEHTGHLVAVAPLGAKVPMAPQGLRDRPEQMVAMVLPGHPGHPDRRVVTALAEAAERRAQEVVMVRRGRLVLLGLLDQKDPTEHLVHLDLAVPPERLRLGPPIITPNPLPEQPGP